MANENPSTAGINDDFYKQLFDEEDSNHPEFDESDDQHCFELWTSDTSSPIESDNETKPDPNKTEIWGPISSNKIKHFPFTGSLSKFTLSPEQKLTPIDCFNLFVDDNVINLMTTETNKYAAKNFSRPGYHDNFLTGWINVTPHEMRQFIGLLVFMSFKRLPATKYYWDGEFEMIENPIAGRVMTETRFQRILKFWYFGDDKKEACSKVINIINMLNANFKKCKVPGESLFVGKATLFVRNKYAFQRGLIGVPKKGNRLLKVLDSDAYTYKIEILPADDCDTRVNDTKEAVLSLLEDYLNQGRCILFHNLYLSPDLARECLKLNTHIVGGLRKKARKCPRELFRKKVVNGQVDGLQSSDGIAVLKYKCLGSTSYALSTYHTLDTVEVDKATRKNGKKVVLKQQKSKFLNDFDQTDIVFDLAEENASIESPVNEEVKWYKRVANDLLVGTAMSNAFVLYNKMNNLTMKNGKFRLEVWRALGGLTFEEKDESSEECDSEMSGSGSSFEFDESSE